MVTTPNFTDGTWNVASTRHIDGDPNGDILWQNIADQSLVLWQQDGATTTAVTMLPSLDNYDVAFVGDFDGDGAGDPLLRDPVAAGTRMVLSSTGLLTNTSTAPASYQPRAASDTTEDGMDDIYWFNTANAVLTAFEMNGSAIVTGINFASGYATDDLLHAVFDGTALNTFKSLWFDDSASQYNIAAYVNGARAINDTFTVGFGRQFVNEGDYSGDGGPDFLFRGEGFDEGEIDLVFTDGEDETARVVFTEATFADVDVVTGGDFDDDGNTELLLREEVTGDLALYQAVGGDAGSETLLGGSANDLIAGRNGDDQLFAGAGDDILLGDDGDDCLVAGDGDDQADGGDEADSLFGGDGMHVLDGDSGNDDIFGGFGDDSLRSGNGTDILEGGPGEDYLRAGSFGFDVMRGGPGDEVIQGIGDRAMHEANDVLFGGSSLDRLFGGLGDDVLIGNLSSDTLFGGAGDDHLIGVDRDGTSGTDDTAFGGSGEAYFHLGTEDENYYAGGGELVIKDYAEFGSSTDFLLLNGTLGKYDFVDTVTEVEIRQSSDADVIAIIETTTTVSQIQATAIFMG